MKVEDCMNCGDLEIRKYGPHNKNSYYCLYHRKRIHRIEKCDLSEV